MGRAESNKDLASRTAALMDALAEYAHLPNVGRVEVTRSAAARFVFHGWEDAERGLCEWAAAFDVPVIVDLSGMGEVFAAITLAGEDVQLVAPLMGTRTAYDLGLVLRVEANACAQVHTTAAELSAAIDASADSIAVAVARG